MEIEIRAVRDLVDSHQESHQNAFRQGMNHVAWTFKSEEINEIRDRIGRYQQLLTIALTLATKWVACLRICSILKLTDQASLEVVTLRRELRTEQAGSQQRMSPPYQELPYPLLPHEELPELYVTVVQNQSQVTTHAPIASLATQISSQTHEELLRELFRLSTQTFNQRNKEAGARIMESVSAILNHDVKLSRLERLLEWGRDKIRR